MSYQHFSHTARTVLKRCASGLIVFTLFTFIAFGTTHTLRAEESASTETTASGTDGANTGQSTTGGTTSTESADINTGNAESSLDANTTVNTNTTTAPTGSDTETTVTNNNTADASTTASVLSTSGENTAEGATSALVKTGNAVSTTNVVNVVNTNTFNANGLLYFLNVLLGNMAFDLRNMFALLTGGTPSLDASHCSLTTGGCTGTDSNLTISNQNVATVENDLTVGASTGDNTASASDGNASITTGDAYAGANVVNFVNTNITDANYLLLTMNAFAKGTGDIIFPGADWFYDLLRGGTGVRGDSTATVTNDNTASVTTNGTVTADTGSNTATSGDATITTGDATASTNVVNKVNTNIFGDSISLLFRVPNDWTGSVFGLPEGMSWRQTGDGVEIFLDSASTSAPTGSTDHLSVTNTNYATVTNNVSVYALTGDNRAEAGAGSADITTGDAQASANIVNVVNTNILGRNWVLAIFNILGSWRGNISFGQPDLWVGARAIAPTTIRGGSCFEYEVTVNNFGDANANDVYLTGIYDTVAQRIEKMEKSIDGRMRYHVGRIAPRTSQTITLPVCLSQYIGAGTPVNTDFTIGGTETDADTSNNTDTIGVVTTAFGGGGKLIRGKTASNANFDITKVASAETITASSSVDYTITITNKGDAIYSALLVDTIYDKNGKAIHEQRWGLDTIHKKETIVIQYTAFFNSSTTLGVYTNKAFISGTEKPSSTGTDIGDPIESPTASVDVEVTAVKNHAPLECKPLLTSYIRWNDTNDSDEVRKLQYFLRSVEDRSEVLLSGEYDQATYDAVHAFQRKYASDILAPWGATETTGFVYYTTQKKVNELWCKDRNFPLTAEQEREIEAFKNRVRTNNTPGTPAQDDTYELIGASPALGREIESLAVTDTAPNVLTPRDAGAESADDQLASVSGAVTNNAVRGVWASVRERISSLFSWIRN